MSFCPNCGAVQPDGAAFCGKCGAKLNVRPQKKICPHCNNELAADMIFCDKCGTKYTAPTPSRPYTPPVAKTGTLTLLSIICILLCWPVAVYGFVCRSRANNASSQKEANSAIRKGTWTCCIAIGVLIIVLFLILWGEGVINW